MNIKSLIIRCLTNYLIAIMEIQKLEFVSKSWEIDTDCSGRSKIAGDLCGDVPPNRQKIWRPPNNLAVARNLATPELAARTFYETSHEKLLHALSL